MHPVLFKIGPITVYSYGVLLIIAFIIGYYFFSREIKRKSLDERIALDITIIAVLCGVIGSKLLFIFENFSQFLLTPVKIAFSSGGFTFLGGLILSFLVSWVYIMIRKQNFLRAADAIAPSLILAYGIGRIGCHLAGDGDYGIPTTLPWGTNYENGIVAPTHLFAGTEYAKHFPNGVFPNNAPLHPTPIYEFLSALIIFFILWKFRKNNWQDGKILTIYLILSSLSRFSVEFIRLNPKIIWGLSQAQVISVLLFTVGLTGFIYLNRKKT